MFIFSLVGTSGRYRLESHGSSFRHSSILPEDTVGEADAHPTDVEVSPTTSSMSVRKSDGEILSGDTVGEADAHPTVVEVPPTVNRAAAHTPTTRRRELGPVAPRPTRPAAITSLANGNAYYSTNSSLRGSGTDPLSWPQRLRWLNDRGPCYPAYCREGSRPERP